VGERDSDNNRTEKVPKESPPEDSIRADSDRSFFTRRAPAGVLGVKKVLEKP